ncbi:hypothetical protein IT415_00245 [bacterium]|nr:hypothetical protein [bacterium]
MSSTPNLPSAQLVDVAKPDHNFFFSLNLTPKTLPSLLVIAGDPGALAEINTWHTITQAWHWSAQYVSTDRTAHVLPTGVVTSIESAGPQILVSDVIVAGFGLHVGSQEQLWLERLLREVTTQVYITAELLPLCVHDRGLFKKQNITPVCAVAEYISLANKLRLPVQVQPGRGIYNVAALLQAMPFTGEMLCAYDAERVYIYLRSQDLLLHVPRDAALTREMLRTYLTSILTAVSDNTRARGQILDQARASLYLASQIRADLTPDDAMKHLRQLIDAAAAA